MSIFDNRRTEGLIEKEQGLMIGTYVLAVKKQCRMIVASLTFMAISKA